MVKGLIYRCKCTKTGQCYIGQTTTSLDRRKRQHINNAFNDDNETYCKFHSALRKYGIDNFKWEILIWLQSDSADNLAESLNELEWYYIKKYNSFKNGYNMTRGGDSNLVKPARTIVLYDVTGEKLQEFDTIDDAAAATNIHYATIKQVLNGILPYVKKSYTRSVFRYDGEDYTKDQIISNLKLLSGENVYVFDLQGKLIDTCLNLGVFCTKYKVKLNQARKCLSKDTPYLICDDDMTSPVIISRGSTPSKEQLQHSAQYFNSPENRSRFFIQVENTKTGETKIYSNLSKASRELNIDYRILQRQLGEFKKEQIQVGNYQIFNMKYYGQGG